MENYPDSAKQDIQRAIQLLANVDDNARRIDDQGFNKFDTSFGQHLAALPAEAWSEKSYYHAWKLIGKYHVQLKRLGLDIYTIPKPEEPKPVRLLTVSGDRLSFKFDYDSKIVGALKEVFRERRWDDKHKQWLVNAPLALARSFAQQHGFQIDPAVNAWTWNDVPERRVERHGDELRFYFPYNLVVKDDLKTAIPSAKFKNQAGTPYWYAPFSTSESKNILDYVEKYAFHLDDVLRAALTAEVQKVERNVEASKAHSAELEIRGLQKTLRPFQKAGVKYAMENERVWIADQMGLGKAQPLDAKVLTPTGWKAMGDIRVGDMVIGSDGCPVSVSGVFPQGEKEVFRITFSDSSQTECCDDHLWLVNTPYRRWSNYGGRVRSLKQIREHLIDGAGNRQHFIPIVAPVEFAENHLPLDAYLLGVLLGDGGLAHRVMFSSADAEIIASVKSALPEGVSVRYCGKYDYAIVGGGAGKSNAVLNILRSMGLMGKRAEGKFIPEIYKFASVETRIAVLQGLLDTDGSVQKDNNIEYSTVSRQLGEDVRFIIQSLGGIARIRTKKTTGQLVYRMSVILPEGIRPFRLSRKANAYHPRPKYPPSRSIAEVVSVGTKECQCIMVDAPDHLYVTDDFIVTHNTVQSIAALHALGAYPALIVVPASLKLNWQREVFGWLPPHIDCTVLSGSKGKQPPKNIQVVIINYDILPGWLDVLSQIQWKAIICDESQYLKSPKTKRTKAVKQVATGYNEDGDTVSPPIPYRFLLSGTPVMNRPKELVPQLEILGRINEFGGGFKFLQRYAGAERTRFGWDMSGAAHLDELNQKLRATCYVRRLKSEVLTELPDKTRVLVPMELDNRREYQEAEADVIEYLKTAKPIVITPPQGLTLEGFKKLQWGYNSKADDNARRGYLRALDVAKDMDEATFARFADAFAEAVTAEARQRGREQAEHLIRFEALKQLAAMGKMEGIKEWVSNFLDTGEKLVLFAHHKEIVKLLADTFSAPSITGDSSLKARDEAVQRFQNDSECRLIVCNIKAGGVGLTLTASSNVAFIELDWTPAAHNQAADRVHRIGQKNAVTEWYLLAEKSIDTEIYELIEAKRVIVDATTEGGMNFEDGQVQMEFSVMNELKDRMKAK